MFLAEERLWQGVFHCWAIHQIVEQAGFATCGSGRDDPINNPLGLLENDVVLSFVSASWRFEMAEVFTGSKNIFLLNWDLCRHGPVLGVAKTYPARTSMENSFIQIF